MAFLSRATSGAEQRTPRRLLRPGRALALLIAIAAAGCAMFGMGKHEPPFRFVHAPHGSAAGIECIDCHRTVQRDDAPGMPLPSQCQLCHQKIDAEKPPERRVATLFDERTFRTTPRVHLAGEVLFSHQNHVASGLRCVKCHEGIETDTAARPAMRMNQCVDCHAERYPKNECATCHRDVRVDRPPPSHAFVWQRMHGKTVRAHSTTTADSCALCHKDSTCAQCHHETPPTSHNNYFRLRGHGVMARMDRENCSTCHRSDSCDSCHSQMLPINHVGLWGTPRDTHCVSCHFPLNTTNCATCHRATPSHDAATPLPPNHNPAMNCRQCHGHGQPLPHVDNGTECTHCHR
jgi:NAD-dependent SIR2 family protein deacetylase